MIKFNLEVIQIFGSWDWARADPRPKTSEAVSSAYKWGKTVANGGDAAWEPTSSSVCRSECCDVYHGRLYHM